MLLIGSSTSSVESFKHIETTLCELRSSLPITPCLQVPTTIFDTALLFLQDFFPLLSYYMLIAQLLFPMSNILPSVNSKNVNCSYLPLQNNKPLFSKNKVSGKSLEVFNKVKV